MTQQLTPNAIANIYAGNLLTNVILQVLEVKPFMINSGDGASGPSERFKLSISDGVHCTFAMLASQMNEMVHSKKLEAKSILFVKELLCNPVKQNMKKIIVILDA